MEAFLKTPFTEPFYFFSLSAVIFMVTFVRYLLVSGAYHYLFFVAFRAVFQQRIIHEPVLGKRQAWLEVYRSAITSVIFAVLGSVLVILWQQGYTQIYTRWEVYPVWYHPLSLAAALLLHETYYYWLHRWMHLPKVYRKIHKWHHDSIETSSLTSFSFHPIESVLQAIVVPVLILFLPMHLYTLFLLLFIMTISGTVNHAAVEVFPKGAERHWLWKWLVGATHHDLHHKQFRFNFGLYFTFWDRWMGTESPDFEKKFRERTAGK